MIDVPEADSFFDLHVAIQDSMRWLDYHLHSFNPPRRHGRIKSKVGVPDDEFNDKTVAGWEVRISELFMEVGDTLEYEYDSSHEEYEGMVEWLKGHAKNYWPYKPDEFEPAAVKFDNPKKRFKIAFSQS